MLFAPGTEDAQLTDANPISLADAAFPPAIFLHATADSLIGSEASFALYRRLSGLGVPTKLHIYAGRDHGFDFAPSMPQSRVK